MTTLDVVQQIIIPETRRFASSYSAHAFAVASAARTSHDTVTAGVPAATSGAQQPVVSRSPPTGRVDYFVSHAWAYPFHHLVDAIRTHHQRHARGSGTLTHGRSKGDRADQDNANDDDKGGGDGETSDRRDNVYYWLDIFAVNQHNVHSAAELPKLRDAITASRGLVSDVNLSIYGQH